MGAILDIGRGIMKVPDLDNLEGHLEKDKEGHLKLKMREGAHRMYIWWNKSDWLIRKEWRKKAYRLHLQFRYCSAAQLIKSLRKHGRMMRRFY